MKKLYWVFLFCILVGTSEITPCSEEKPPRLDWVETLNIENTEM